MTKIVGILNITPDSFSDGGKYNKEDIAVKRAEELCNQGAYAIDVGAESTRPNAIKISPEEEWNRLHNILHKVLELNLACKISIDTQNIETVEKSLELGIKWINDVSGIADNEIINLIKLYDSKITIMHNLGLPASKDIIMSDDVNFIDEIYNWGKNTISKLVDNGIKREKIIFDPGIGFGKTSRQSMEIIDKANFFRTLDVPIMIGHSRKSFLELIIDKNTKNRDDKTIVISKQLVSKKIDYIRVHNVKDNFDVIFEKAPI